MRVTKRRVRSESNMMAENETSESDIIKKVLEAEN